MRRDRFLQSLASAAAARAAGPSARRRRICVQYDAADHRDVKLPPAQWLQYLFTFADQPGSQIDTIFWAVALGDTYAVYPSRILPPSPDTQLVAWRKQGFEWVPALLRRGENRIAVRVLDRGAYRIGEGIQVEKVEITGG